MPPVRYLALSTLIMLGLAFRPGVAAAANDNSEAHLAKASAAFYAQDYPQVLKSLEAALNLNSTDPQALELLALTLKTQERFPEALKIYQSLLQIAKLENWPAARKAPYVFETALIEFSQGQFRRAAVGFLTARQSGFNADTAMFFQGLCRYREGDAKGAAKVWELLGKSSKTPEITAAALYYRARVALDQKAGAQAAALLRQAEQATQDQTGELATQIRAQTQAALQTSEQTRFLAGVETSSEYDSNALLLSDDLRLSRDESSTFRQTLLAALAAGRDHGNDGAWYLGFRSIINYNANKKTKSSEFAANEIDGAWMFANLGSVRMGPTARALALFRNQSVTGSEDFHTYLLSGSAGWAIESYAGPNLWRVEANAGNARFLDDADLDPEMRRTGLTADAAGSWRRDEEAGRFNPFARVEAVRQWTAGPEYRALHARFLFGNKFYLGNWQLLAQGSAGLSEYADRVQEKRHDKLFALDAIASRTISKNFSFLLRLGVAANQSSLEELYSYQREIVGAGLRYVF